LTRQYPQVSRSKLKGRSANQRCSCCLVKALWRIEIRISWFRGEDVEAVACDPHRQLAYADPDDFMAQVEQHRQYMNVRIQAQHEETGRTWSGPRRDLPRRYVEVIQTDTGQ
jgi:hypothetical protein